MKIKIRDGSPDGMHVSYYTYLMSWDDLKDFIDAVSLVESGKYKKVLAESRNKQLLLDNGVSLQNIIESLKTMSGPEYIVAMNRKYVPVE